MSPPVTFPSTLGALFHLWNNKRDTRAMPSRRDFTTVELQPWLSELHLVAVHPEGLRFVVFAPGPADRYGADMTGRYVSDLEPPELAREAGRAYSAAIETRAPMFSTQSASDSGRRRSWSRLILPLSDDGLAVDRLFVAMWDEGSGFGLRSGVLQSLLISKWVLAESESELPRSTSSVFDPARIAPNAAG
jgi:hypothetical protein